MTPRPSSIGGGSPGWEIEMAGRSGMTNVETRLRVGGIKMKPPAKSQTAALRAPVQRCDLVGSGIRTQPGPEGKGRQ